jgi:hypothetical protein
MSAGAANVSVQRKKLAKAKPDPRADLRIQGVTFEAALRAVVKAAPSLKTPKAKK